MKYKCNYCKVNCVLEIADGAAKPYVCPYRPETNEHGLQDDYTDPPWEVYDNLKEHSDKVGLGLSNKQIKDIADDIKEENSGKMGRS